VFVGTEDPWRYFEVLSEGLTPSRSGVDDGRVVGTAERFTLPIVEGIKASASETTRCVAAGLFVKTVAWLFGKLFGHEVMPVVFELALPFSFGIVLHCLWGLKSSYPPCGGLWVI
jgi:hypothetical protein